MLARKRCAASVHGLEALLRLFLVIFALALTVPIANAATGGSLIQKHRYEFDHRYSKVDTDQLVDGGRFEIWEETFNHFLQNPVVGTGWALRGRTGLADAAYVHNLVLYWLGASGIIGSIIFISLLLVGARFVLLYMSFDRYTTLKLGLLGYFPILIVFNLVGVVFAELALIYVGALVIALVLRIAALDAADGPQIVRSSRP